MYGSGLAFGHLILSLSLSVPGFVALTSFVEWFVYFLFCFFLCASFWSVFHSFQYKVSSFSFHISYACYSSKIYDGHVAVIWHKIFLAFCHSLFPLLSSVLFGEDGDKLSCECMFFILVSDYHLARYKHYIEIFFLVRCLFFCCYCLFCFGPS